MALRSRSVLRAVGGVVALAVLVSLVWVFPAVYDKRYNPLTRERTPAEIAWHPDPTAEQDAAYLENTQTDAPFPNTAVEGRDGWWFLGDAFMANFAQAMGRRYYSRDEVQWTVDATSSRYTWLADRGIPSEFVVVPAKWSIYPDKMPAWTDGAVLPHILDQLITADAASFPDMRPALTQARAIADTHSPLNSHWTQYGAFEGYRWLMGTLLADHPEVGPLTVPELTGVTTVDGFNEMAGITGAAGPNQWTEPQLNNPLPSYTLIATDGTRSTVPGDQLLDITQMPLQTENPAAGNNHRVLVLADSATTSLSPYLAATFGSTMMVRHWMDEPMKSPNIPALVESYQPDIVLTLLSERNLNIVTPDSETWKAGVAYDMARPKNAGDPQQVGLWSADGKGFAMSVSGNDLTVPITATLTAPPEQPVVLRIDLDATDSGLMTVSGTSADGPFLTTLRIAVGHNVLFAEVPASVTGGTFVLQRASGQGTWTTTAVAARAESA